MKAISVADIEGPWVEPNFDSGLIKRCKDHWAVPLQELLDLMVATFLTQEIAAKPMAEEAQRRLDSGIVDDTELYDGQLAESLKRYLK
jgi:hypothetical protein